MVFFSVKPTSESCFLCSVEEVYVSKLGEQSIYFSAIQIISSSFCNSSKLGDASIAPVVVLLVDVCLSEVLMQLKTIKDNPIKHKFIFLIIVFFFRDILMFLNT